MNDHHHSIGIPGYECDADINNLIQSQRITEQQVLDFFYKKQGCVNVESLQFLIEEYGLDGPGIGNVLDALQQKKLIDTRERPLAMLTGKARRRRLLSNKHFRFWTIVIVSTCFFLLMRHLFQN